MKKILLFFVGMALFTACANIVAPTGGEKDEQAPQLLEDKSTPNFQIQFEKQGIELVFDEWIQLENINRQMVISPPLEFDPEVSLKGKGIRLEFDEEETLREQTTYTIGFGEAIQDITEKNSADELKFVFSTGDFIDSLQVKGKVVDALTGEAVKDVLVMLYENQADTVVRTIRPYYFGKTKEDGNFQINNVKSSTFKVFALADVDYNYLFNLTNEQIGFPDDFVTLPDSTLADLRIKLFLEEEPLQLLYSDYDRYGQVNLLFNHGPEAILEVTADSTNLLFDVEKDTLKVWYDHPRNWSLFLRKDTLLDDTLRVKIPPRSDLDKDSLRVVNAQRGTKHQGINPDKPVEFIFNHPVRNIDTALFQLYEDTLRIPVYPDLILDSLLPRKLILNYKWKEDFVYELNVLPGAVTDMFDLVLEDSLNQFYLGKSREAYGGIKLKLQGLSPDTSYAVKVLLGDKDLIRKYQLLGPDIYEYEIKALKPGDYTIEVVTDLNANGKWDPGNYDLKLQPEPIFRKKLEKLRANWEVEALIDLQAVPEPEESLEETGNK